MINYHAVNIFSISQSASSQQQIIRPKRNGFLPLRDLASSFEFINCIIWFLTSHKTGHLCKMLFIRKGGMQLSLSCFHLEIGFTVKVLGLNAASSLQIRRMQDQNVCWYGFVSLDLYDIARMQLLPTCLDKQPIFSVEYPCLRSILFIIRLCALVVFISIFDHTHNDNKNQWSSHRWLSA